jgi:phospholipid/cholesterol/gamma-HCH transport system substrate-binding protein
MQSRALEILVGFFVCLGVAAVFVLTFRVASLDSVGSHGSYKVNAKFENVGSLTQGASVKLAGVRIGRVRTITIDPQSFEARVSLEISSEFANIPTDTMAKIQTAGLLGEQYIGLEPGGADESLKNGDALRLTQSAFVLENLIGQFLVSATQKSSAPAAAAPESKPVDKASDAPAAKASAH